MTRTIIIMYSRRGSMIKLLIHMMFKISIILLLQYLTYIGQYSRNQGFVTGLASTRWVFWAIALHSSPHRVRRSPIKNAVVGGHDVSRNRSKKKKSFYSVLVLLIFRQQLNRKLSW